LVERFKKLREDTSYLDKFDNEYVPLVSKCIKSMTDKKDDEFFNYLLQLSKLQLELLTHTIPEETRDFFLTDIKEDGFQVKLCGAGGGGFLLGFTKDMEKTSNYWQDTEYHIHWVK
jgi:mevalonate kinase